MRGLAAALALLILVAICSLAEADLRVSRSAALSKKNEAESASCCLSYVSRPIPRRTIRSAYRTGNACPMQAVVLITRKGRKVCVDPEAPWVQKYLEHSELLEY